MKKFTLVLITLVCMVLTLQKLNAQVLIGSPLYGEAIGDGAKENALNADGTIVAYGARHHDANGNDAGHVRVFQWDGNSWSQIGENINGMAAGDEAGFVDISADGTRIIISAPFNDNAGAGAGLVRVMEWNGSSWTQLGQNMKGIAAGDQLQFGHISDDGNIISMGSARNDSIGTDAGYVKVFQWTGSEWAQMGTGFFGENAGDKSGFNALSGSGTRVAVGARLSDDNGVDAGKVRIFEWDGSEWIQVGADITGESAGDESGMAVALSTDGSVVAIGARLNDGNGVDAGHVRIFQFDGYTWNQMGGDIDGDAPGDYCGNAIALSANGERVAVGARLNDGFDMGAGQVRVFDWDGSDWVQVGVSIYGDAFADQFSSPSLSASGTILSAAAPNNDEAADNAGKLRVFELPQITTSIQNSAVNPFVKIFPNPVIDHLNIEFENDQWFDRLELFDLQGQLIESQRLDSSPVYLATSQFPPGMYILKLSGQKQLSRKIMIH